MKQYSKHIFVCELGGDCPTRGAEGMRTKLKDLIASRGLEGKVKVTKTGCIGACGYGPNLVIYPEGIWYCRVRTADLDRIIDETVVGGRLIDDLLFHKLGDPSVIEMVKDPVCKMVFRQNEAVCSEVTTQGTAYFCSESCRRAYLSDPAAYAGKKHSHAGTPVGPGGHHSH